ELRRSKFPIGKVTQQSLHWLRQPNAMALAVLGPRPAFGWLARHFPPAIDDVLGAHMRYFARTLPGQQDELERSPGEAGLIESGPEPWQLTVGQDALAARGLMAINPVARIDRDDLLLHRPGEDRTCRREHLIG